MIRVNDIIVDFGNPTEHSKKYVNRINEVIERLRQKTGDEVRLFYTMAHGEEVETSTGVKSMHYAEMVTITATATMYVDSNAEQWTYYNTVKKFGNQEIFEPRHLPFNVSGYLFNLAENYDKGLLYYLIFVSPLCQKIPSMADYQTSTVKMASYHVEMPEIEAAEKLSLNREISIVVGKIYDPNTSIEQLRTWAMSYRMPKCEKMGEAQLRLKLEQIVRANPMQVNEFLKDSNINPMVRLKAEVNKSFNKNIVLLDKRFGRKTWRYTGVAPKKMEGEVICVVPPGKEENEALYEYFSMHPSSYDILKQKNEQ